MKINTDIRKIDMHILYLIKIDMTPEHKNLLFQRIKNNNVGYVHILYIKLRRAIWQERILNQESDLFITDRLYIGSL